MAVTAVRTTSVAYSGDEVGSSGSNTLSRASTNTNAVATGSSYQSLASGANTVTVPTGFTVNGVDIIPPSANTTSLTIKGVTGDTGVRLHNTIPTSLPLDTSVATFVLTTGAAMTVRLAWW